MKISRAAILTWLFGALLLSGSMGVCAWLYLDEQVEVIFIILACTSGALVFLNYYFGFLFLTALVGPFLFMGYFSEYFWESKSLEAYQQFEKDTQLKYAISSLYVIDAKTGKVIFNKT